MINGTTDEAGAGRTSSESGKEEIIRGGKRVDWNGTAMKITRRFVEEIGSTSITSIAGETGEEMIGIKAERKGSAQRKGTQIEIKARLDERAKGRIHVAHKLMIKEAIR
jgi:hypothetical protein